MSPRARRVWSAVAVLVPVGAALAAGTLIAAGWPRYWVWIATEQTPMTWIQSVVLVLCAAVAAGLALDAYLAERPARAPTLLAAGFAVLALDERFALHERLRDGLLAPAGVRVPFLPWVGPGDFLLLGLALAGLAVLPLVLPLFAGDRTARSLLLAGVLGAGAAVAADSFDPARMPLAVERAEQTIEELAELSSGVLLLLALVRLHVVRLGWHHRGRMKESHPRAVPAPPAGLGGGGGGGADGRLRGSTAATGAAPER